MLLLLHAPKHWYSETPIVALAIAGIVFRRARESSIFWFTIASFLGSNIYFNWYSLDNHKYLEFYWTLALFGVLSLPAPRREGALALNARLLIGLCMALAALWKCISSTYLPDSAFFRFTLLTDDRFEYFAHWFGGISHGALQRNQELEDLLKYGYLEGINLSSVPLVESGPLRALARFATWWTVAIEATLGVLFLWPGGRRVRLTRDLLLLAFAVTTYLVANVKGFGWLLMILGIAQCSEERKIVVNLYLFAFIIIQFYTIPYGPVIEALSRSW